MNKRERIEAAATIRDLAKEFEEFGVAYVGILSTEYTCNAIRRAFGGHVPCPVRDTYEGLFGFGMADENNSEQLWDSENLQDLRVMMLCLFAAMVESGDAL